MTAPDAKGLAVISNKARAPPSGRTIQRVELEEALDRCRWPVGELQNAKWSFSLGRGDFGEFVRRIETVWTAWHQHERVELAARAELLEAMDRAAAALASGKFPTPRKPPISPGRFSPTAAVRGCATPREPRR